jgi:hypothetical protein
MPIKETRHGSITDTEIAVLGCSQPKVLRRREIKERVQQQKHRQTHEKLYEEVILKGDRQNTLQYSVKKEMERLLRKPKHPSLTIL